MKVAVQTRSDSRLYCKILYGTPERIIAGAEGEIAIFTNGIVAYFMAWGERKKHVYVFRCESGEQKIPGVYPAVRLLMEAKTRTKVARVRRLLVWLEKEKISLDGISLEVFARFQALIEGKKLLVKDIKKVVKNEYIFS